MLRVIILSRTRWNSCELDSHVAWQAIQHDHEISYRVDGSRQRKGDIQ